MYLRPIFISILGLLFLTMNAQEDAIVLRGKLINAANEQSIPNANIIIINRNLGISSNSEGTFNLLASIQDTLKITAIGFKEVEFIIQDTLRFDSIIIIRMTPAIYELETIEITPFLSYAELREAIINYKLTEEEMQFKKIKTGLKKILKYSEIRGRSKPSIMNPVSLLYSVFGSHAKYLRKVKRIKSEDQLQSAIYRKYNPEIVGRLIGEEDKDYIQKFMDYCNFSNDYLLEVRDVDLYKNLLIRYDLFVKANASN